VSFIFATSASVADVASGFDDPLDVLRDAAFAGERIAGFDDFFFGMVGEVSRATHRAKLIPPRRPRRHARGRERATRAAGPSAAPSARRPARSRNERVTTSRFVSSGDCPTVADPDDDR
jgi:hypothetical protein